jgi:hypothetical protein
MADACTNTIGENGILLVPLDKVKQKTNSVSVMRNRIRG